MDNKRIVFVSPNVAELQDCPAERPGKGEVLVRLAISTISSGTERANLTGEVNVSIADTPPEPVFPRFAGYSTSGTVEEIGEGVTSLNVGDRVAMSWTTHKKYVCVPEQNVYKLGTLPFETGALVHIATFPLAAVRKCRVEIGEPVLVMGQGVLGQIAVQLLRAAGAVPIIAADPKPEKRAKALEYGADHALDPFDPNFTADVKRLTGGGAHAAIEVTGQGKALDQALDCMARFGRIALLGCTRHSDFSIDYYHKVHGPGITLIGAHTMARPVYESYNGMWTQRDDAEALLKLLSSGRLDLGRMVEETYSPADAPEVYARLAASPAFPTTQFDWRKL